ncbi:hypothetical protein J3458_014401 [Metarhizium acridum]|uniref:uncharacterized protein n=1 Tax=Metarhizium acridum TaxID=92637 RepID=UPI001C6C2C5E|nr:hypothetical protein J3458_014401 [Metarhizium acridum]
MKYSASLAVMVGLAKASPLVGTAAVSPGSWHPRPTIGVQEFLTLSQSFKFEIRSGHREITNLPGSATGFFWRVVYDLDRKGSFRFETCEREQHGRVFTKIQGQYVPGYAVKYSQATSGAEFICDSGVLSYVKVQSSGAVVTAVTETTVIEKYSNTMYACTEAAHCVPSKCEKGCEKGVKDNSAPSGGVLIPKPGPSKRALYFLESNPAGASISDCRSCKMVYWIRAELPSVLPGLCCGQWQIPLHGKFRLNAIALFEISDADPASLKRVGEPVHIGGEFPNSVAVSDKNNMACVANTGRGAGVQCFNTLDHLELLGEYMPLPVTPTTPSVGPPNSVSDIVFNPSQTALFVTIKGNGIGRGYVYAYKVVNGRINPQPVISRPPGSMLDFSLTFLSDSTGVVTDPAYGASYNRNLSVTASNQITIPGQGATCWSVFAPEFDTVYLSDGASPNIIALDPMSGRTKFVITGDTQSTCSFDSAVDRSSLYVLQGSPAVAVFDLRGSKGGDRTPSLSQYLNLSSVGARSGWIGMVVYSG